MAGVCGGLVAAKGPLNVLISSLVEEIWQAARAEGRTKPRNYLHLNLPGGPCRWFFDLPLLPYSNSGELISDPQIVTRINVEGQPEYHTAPITVKDVTLNMPTLWSSEIPTPSGAWIPMAKLLENMIMIRGVNMQADGHPPNNFKQVRPVQGMPSLTGLVADASDKPIPAVGGSRATPYSVYKSGKGIGQVVVPDFHSETNPLAKILGAFDAKGDKLPEGFVSRRQALSGALDQAMVSLGNYAKSSEPGAENLFALRSRAEKLVRQGLGDLETAYGSLLQKYKGLIEQCKTRNVVGVNDQPILGSAFPRLASRTVMAGSGRVIVNNADLRDLITGDSRIDELAEGCAVAEYLLLQGYSSTVLWGPSGVDGMDFHDLATVETDAGGNETGQTSLGIPQIVGNMVNDEHFSGNAISLVGNSFLFRAIAACLYELISVLKGAGLFSETVIQIGAEFSRIPRKDFGGSEHGWMANCTSLFSGAVNKPMVLGNIASDGSDGVFNPRKTTWGKSAPVEVDGAVQILTIGHSTSTIAQLLHVAPPLPSNGTLIFENPSTGLFPTIELAKNKVQT